jgi:peptide/nickel transport system ATP-binding protein
MVFQDSTGSLNPSLSIGRSVQLQAMAAGTDDALARTMACKMLDEVGLDHRQYFERLPHQLSGGQRQRVNIARALVTSPRLVVLDEPLSALDKTVEAQIMLLLARLRRQLGLTYVFITHDLAIAKGFCDEVVVLYRGRVLEQGPVQSVFEAPAHPYTAMLLAAQLSDDPESKNLQGPNPADDDMSVELPIEGGCAFASRCPVVRSDCTTTLPGLRVVGPGHLSACLRSGTDVPRIRGEH